MLENKDIISIMKTFKTLYEERVLDEVCGHYGMEWDTFINEIRGGWKPEVGGNGETYTAPNEFELKDYRNAIEYLRENGVRIDWE